MEYPKPGLGRIALVALILSLTVAAHSAQATTCPNGLSAELEGVLHSLEQEHLGEKALADATTVGHAILKGDHAPETLFAFVEHVALYSKRPEALVYSLENTELLRTFNRIEAATHGFGGSKARNLISESRVWAKRMKTIEPPWEPVMVEENGQQIFRRFTHQAAEAHAAKEGLRLPTPYELARLSEGREAKGIAESAHYDVPVTAGRVDTGRVRRPGADLGVDEVEVMVSGKMRIYKKGPVERETDAMRSKGYRAIYRLNPDNQMVVDFYFNNSGYKRPEGQERDGWFWSSSVRPGDSYNAYALYGDDGDIDSCGRSYGFGALRGVRVRPRGP